jgi:hypothetical protein
LRDFAIRWWKPRKSNRSAPAASGTMLVCSGARARPERHNDRRHRLAGRLGLPAGGAGDDEVVCLADHYSRPPPLAPPGLVEALRGGRLRAAARAASAAGARFQRGHDPGLEDARPKPAPRQLQQPPIPDPALDPSAKGVVIDLVETAFDVGVEHPPPPAPGERPADRLPGHGGPTAGAETDTGCSAASGSIGSLVSRT